ncbi:uncharacterized protein LOC144924161 [Branchiostoma floridae x Branchiostoma belcheri]
MRQVVLSSGEAHPGFLFTTPSTSRSTFQLQMIVDHAVYQAFVPLPDDWWSHIFFGRTHDGKAVMGVNGVEVSDVTSAPLPDVDEGTNTWLFIGPTVGEPITSTVTFDQVVFYERWSPSITLLEAGIKHKLTIKRPDALGMYGDLACRAVGDVTTTNDSPTGSGKTLGNTGYLDCGNKYMSCVGSTIYCPRGFSLVFWLKVQCDDDVSDRTVLSNIGESYPETSRGVRLLYRPGSQELAVTMATREGDVFETQAAIQLDTWTEIRVVGSNEGTTLIVGDTEYVGVNIASFDELTYDNETALMIGRDSEKACPIPGYFPFNGICYKSFAEKKTYVEARQRCAEDGGLLAMPKDSAINDFIFYLGDDHRWLGITDINIEGQWIFEDGQSLASSGYSNWNSNEPNNLGGENCAHFLSGPLWNDISCSRTYGFICQIYVDQETHPVGLWPLNAVSGALDETGNGNDAVATGTQLTSGPFGDADGAFLFAGTAGSYLDIPNNGKLDVRYSYTILAHIYPTGPRGPIFHYRTNTNAPYYDHGVHFWQVEPGQLFNRVIERGMSYHTSPFVVADVLVQNAWNYVGGSYNSVTGMASLWYNGEFVGETYAGYSELETQAAIRVAMREVADSRYFAGRIACLQLYDFAMTQAQVEAARYKCKPRDKDTIQPSLAIADFQFKEYALTPKQLRTIDSYLGFGLYLPMEDMKEGDKKSVHASSETFLVGECDLVLVDGVVDSALQLRGYQEKATAAEFQYRWDLPAITSSPLRFEVKTGGTVHIALSRKNGYRLDMYEVVLDDTSEIRRNQDSKIAVPTPNILYSHVYKRFWISWMHLDEGNVSIAVGREDETEPFMQWTDPVSPLPILYAGYSTSNNKGDWKFSGECQASVETKSYVTDTSETLSILLWAKFSYPLKGRYFYTTSSSNNTCGLSLEAKDDNSLEFKVRISQKEWSVVLGVSDQYWVHLAFAWSRTGNLDTYINGFKHISVPGNDWSTTDQNCFESLVFNSLPNDVAWDDRLEFLIDEFRMDDTTFEEDRLKYLYGKGARIRSYYFSIDHRSGNDLLDANREASLTHHHHLHLQQSLNGHGVWLDKNRYVLGGPYHFMCLGNPSHCINGFSMSLWFKEFHIPGINGSTHLISAGDEMGNSPDGFQLYHQGWGDVYVLTVTKNGTTQKMKFGIREKLWTHVHMTWMGNLSVTINGVPFNGEVVYKQEPDATGIKMNSTILKLGAPVNGEQSTTTWQIVLDDIRFWEEVVPVEDAREDYASLALKREYFYYSKGHSDFGEFPTDCLGSTIYCSVSFTLAAWVFPTAETDDVQTMLSNSGSHNHSRGFTVNYHPLTQTGTVLLTTVNKQFTATFPMLKEKWVHVTISWDVENDDFYLYLNGRRFLGEIEEQALQTIKTDPHTTLYFKGRYRLLSSKQDSSAETIYFKEGILPAMDVLNLYRNGNPTLRYDIPMTTSNGSFVQESFPLCSIHGEATTALHGYRPHLNLSSCAYLDCGKLSLECLVDHTMCYGMAMSFRIAYSGSHPVKIVSVMTSDGDEVTSVDCEPESSNCMWRIEDAMLNFTAQPDEWNFIQLTMNDKYEMEAYVNGHFIASTDTDLQFEWSFNTTTVATLKLGAMADACEEGADRRLQFAGWWFKDSALKTSELRDRDTDWDASIYLPMEWHGQQPPNDAWRTIEDTVQLVDGMVGKAARMDGSGLENLLQIDKVNLPRCLVDSNTLTRGYTVSVWLFALPAGQEKNYYLDFHGDHHNSWGFSLYHDPVEKYHVVIVSTPYHSWKVTFPPFVYRWTHVAFSFSPQSASVSLFLDGMLYKTSSDPVDRKEEPIYRSGVRANFGARYAGNILSLPGIMLLDDFRFIERQLTPEEVFLAFRSPLESTTPSLCLFCGGLAPGSKMVDLVYDPSTQIPASYQESDNTAFSVENGSLHLYSYRTSLLFTHDDLESDSSKQTANGFTLGLWLTVNRELQGLTNVLDIPTKGISVSLANSTGEEAYLSVGKAWPDGTVTVRRVNVSVSCHKPMLVLARWVDDKLLVNVNGDDVGDEVLENTADYHNGLLEILGTENGTTGPLLSLESVLFWNDVVPTAEAYGELTGAREEKKWDFSSSPHGVHLNGYEDGDLIPLGMESWGITADQLSAAGLSGNVAAASRLNTLDTPEDKQGGGWCASGSNQWLQVDLGRRTYVKGVMTQGHSDHVGWVTSYQLSFSLDGSRFTVYSSEEDGSSDGGPVVFSGNSDSSSIVRHDLDETVVTRYVRFLPKAWHSSACMRVELLGSTRETKNTGTNIAIGKATTQSSVDHDGYSHRAVDTNKGPSWGSQSCTHTVDENDPWWSVDLELVTPIDRVVIYNRQDGTYDSRINPFNVHVGESPSVHENDKCGEDHVFGRGQAEATVYCGGMEGRYVGIRLPGFRVLNLCEVEVYSTSLHHAQNGVSRWRSDQRCGLGFPAPDGRPADCPQHGTPCCSMLMYCGNSADHCDCPNCVDSRKEVPRGIQCSISQPVGMESGTIQNHKVTASSRHDESYVTFGRLDQFDIATVGDWGPSQNDIHQWLQVDIGSAFLVTGVITQGSVEGPAWVKSYKLQFSTDALNWITQLDQSGNEKEFQGNVDQNTPVPATLPAPVAARYVRFLPQTWQNNIRMRVEVLACSKEANFGRLWMDTNVALRKSTRQSTTAHHGDSSRAVDGNTGPNWNSYSCIHTGTEDAPWWAVDLGAATPVDRVVIYNRLDVDSLNINPFNVHIGQSPTVEENEKCGENHTMTSTQRSLTVHCGGMEGRYVGIQLVPLSTRRNLHVCEVEVYSSSLYNIQQAAASQWTSLGRHEDACLTDPRLCRHGFTLDLSFGYNEGSGDQVILSAGGGSDYSSGFFFAYTEQSFEVAVNDGTSLWKVRFDMRPGWTHISFNWHRSMGLTVQLDGVVAMKDSTGTPCDGCSAEQKLNNEVYIGRGTAVPETSMEFWIKHVTFFEGLKDVETLVQTEGVLETWIPSDPSMVVSPTDKGAMMDRSVWTGAQISGTADEPPYIVVDLQAFYKVTRIFTKMANQFAEEVRVFTESTSLSCDWKEVGWFRPELSNSEQTFGGFAGTGRFWKLVFTPVQPHYVTMREVRFYGQSAMYMEGCLQDIVVEDWESVVIENGTVDALACRKECAGQFFIHALLVDNATCLCRATSDDLNTTNHVPELAPCEKNPCHMLYRTSSLATNPISGLEVSVSGRSDDLFVANETITISVDMDQGDEVELYVEAGGEALQEVPGFAYSVVFQTAGVHTVNVIASNTVSRVEKVALLKVVEVPGHFDGLELVVSPGRPNENVTMYALVGDPDVTGLCFWKPGDSNLTYSVDVTAEKTYKEDNRSVISFSHVYSVAGVYDVEVLCANEFGQANATASIYIEDPVEATIHGNTRHVFGQNITVYWDLIAGTNIQYTLSFGESEQCIGNNSTVGNETIQNITCLVDPDVYSHQGTYTVEIFAYNQVSRLAKYNYVDIGKEINGIKIADYSTFAVTSTSYDFSANVDVLPGTNCDVLWYKNLEPTSLVTGVVEGEVSSHIHFNESGYLLMLVEATNAVSVKNDRAIVISENPVKDLSINVLSPINPSVPAKVVFTVGEPQPDNAVVYFTFGDGSQTEVVAWDDVLDGYEHSYPDFGDYTLVVVVQNHVSKSNITDNVRVGRPARNLQAEALAPYVRARLGVLSVRISTEQGSGVVYKVDFGDGTIDEVPRLAEDMDYDIQILNHTYAQPGPYVINVKAVSRFGTMETNTDVVISQHPIRGVTLENSSPTVVPPGKVIFIFRLEDDIPPPTDASCRYYLGQQEISDVRDFLDFVDKIHTWKYYFGENLFGVHEVDVSCENHVSQVEFKTSVTLQELVGGLQVEISPNPIGVGNALTIEVELVLGNMASFEIHYGDATEVGRQGPFYERGASFNLTHVYSAEGNYTVAVTAQNNISSTLWSAPAPGVVARLRITEIFLISEYFVTLPTEGSVDHDFEVRLPMSDAYPSGMYVEFTLDSGVTQNSISGGLSATGVHHGAFPLTKADVGMIQAVVTVYNLVTSVTVEHEMEVQEVITGLHGLALAYVIPVNSDAIFLLSVVTGSHVTFRLDYGDDKSDVLQHPNMFAVSEVTEPVHSYNDSGTYKLTVTAWNNVSSAMYDFEQVMTVEYPVANLFVTVNNPFPVPPGIATVTVGVLPDTPPPSSVRCQFDFSDGAVDDPMAHNLSIGATHSQQHTYDVYSPLEKYVTRVWCRNGISSQFIEKEVTFEGVVSGLTAVTDIVNVPVNGTVCLTIGVTRGSDLNFTVEYGDGTIKSVLPKDREAKYQPTFVYHSFEDVGKLSISVTASNAVSQQRFDVVQDITVQMPISGFSLDVPSPIPVPPGTAVFEVEIDGNLPTDANYVWQFGDGTTLTEATTNKRYTKTHTYDRSSAGKKNVSLTCSNLVSSVTETAVVEVFETIVGLALNVSSHIVTVGSITEFTITMAKGSSVVYDVNFGDGNSVTLNQPLPHNVSRPVHFTYTYTSSGIFDVHVTASNDVSQLQVALATPITTQFVITNLTLTYNDTIPYPPGQVSFVVSVPPSIIPPTNITIHVEFGDGTSEDRDAFDITTDNPVIIAHQYDQSAVGKMQVSIECLNLVSKKRFDVSVIIQERITGLSTLVSTDRTNVGREVTVDITVATGSHLTFEADFGDGKTQVSSFLSRKTVTMKHTYNDEGYYKIHFAVSNAFGNFEDEATISVQHPVFGLNMAVNNPVPLPEGLANFVINIPLNVSLPTDTSVHWSFGDGSSETTEINLKHTNHFLHQYESAGRYYAKCVVSNLISTKTLKITVDIIETITGIHLQHVTVINPMSSMFDEDDPSISYQGLDEDALWRTSILTGSNTTYVWDFGDGSPRLVTVRNDVSHRYNRAGNFVVNVTAENQVSRVDTNMTVAVRQGIILESFGNTGPAPLPNSTVSLVLNVTQFGTDSCYLFDMGDERVRIVYGAEICKEIDYFKKDEIVTIDETDTIIHDYSYNQDGFFDVRVTAMNRVSFQQMETRVKSEHILEATGTEIVIPPLNLDVGLYKLEITVAMPGFEGLENGDSMYLSVVKSKLVVGIKGGASRPIGYGLPMVLDAVDMSYDPDDPHNKTANTARSSLFTIEGGSLESGFHYNVRLTLKQYGYAAGFTEYTFVTNCPPTGGHCDITPTFGYALETEFQVTCAGWWDEGDYLNYDEANANNYQSRKLKYRFWTRRLGSGQQSLIKFGEEPFTPKLTLPLGPAAYNHTLEISVQIVDTLGEYALVNMTIQVVEYPETDTENKLLELTNPDKLSMLVLGGKQQSIGQIGTIVADTINEEDETDNDEEQAEQKKKRHEQMRSSVVSALYQTAGSVTSVEAVQQSCITMKAITEKSSEVSPDTQVTAASAVENMAEKLQGIDMSEELSENIESTATELVSSLSNILVATDTTVQEKIKVPGSEGALDVMSLSPEEAEQRERDLQAAEETQHDDETLAKDTARQVSTKTFKAATAISGLVMKTKTIGSPAMVIDSPKLSMVLERSEPTALAGKAVTARGGSFNIPPAISAKLGESSGPVDMKVMSLPTNPFIWDESASSINSPVVSLAFQGSDGNELAINNMDEPFEIKINNSPEKVPKPKRFDPPNPPDDSEEKNFYYDYSPEVDMDYAFHVIDVPRSNNAIRAVIRPGDPKMLLMAYLRVGDYPSSSDFNVSGIIPREIDMNGTFTREELEEIRHSVMVPEEIVYTNISWYLAIQEIDPESKTPLGAPSSNYTLQTLILGCKFWSETEERWAGDGCKVSDKSTANVTVCECTHLTSFGSELFTPPNTIDFKTVFSKNIAENAYVLGTVLGITALYLICVYFARKGDNKDVEKWSVSQLSDNRLIDNHFYEITVQTGIGKTSGTKSEVFFTLYGEDENTRTRTLKAKNKELSSGSVNKFLMAEHKHLGALQSLRIWHNNSGKGAEASWYLDRVQVRDLDTDKMYYFLCDKWLAVNEDDGEVCRTLPVATEEDMKQFNTIFFSAVKKDFNDGHLWFSVFSRPTRSNFTRVQRVTCCLSLLFCTMVSNAMWYDTEKKVRTVHALTIGPITLTWHQLYVSFMSSILIFPVNIGLVTLFRRIREKESSTLEVDVGEDSAETVEKGDCKDHQDKQSKKKKKKLFMFPHWMVYVAWIIAFLVTFTSAFFSVLYSLDWGAKKSIAWLTSMLMSFTMSVFVVDPIKVVFLAAVLSLLIRKPSSDEEDNSDDEEIQNKLQDDEDWVNEMPSDDDDEPEDKLGVPDPTRLAEAKEKMQKKAVMSDLIREIARYGLLVLVLMLIAYNNKDPSSYNMVKTFRDNFVHVELPLENVRTGHDFWTWVNDTLIPGLYTGSWYNGKPTSLLEQQFLADKLSFRVGPARMRQLRVPPSESCLINVDVVGLVEGCTDEYSMELEDQMAYLPGWKYHPNASVLTDDLRWVYQSSADLGVDSTSGRLATYSGGGYEANFGTSNLRAKRVSGYLQSHGWIDRLTRAIIIEFTAYNANVNLFVAARYILEFGAIGAGLTGQYDIQVLLLYNYVGPFGIFNILIEVIYVVYLCYSMFKEGKSMKELGCKKYFADPWNMLEILIILGSLISIGFYATKTIITSFTLSSVQASRDDFVSFQSAITFHSAYSFTLAFVVFLSTLKFMKLLRFNKKISMLSATVRHSSAMMVPFGFQFGLVVFAFVHFASVAFGANSLAYTSVMGSFQTIFSMLLGKFDHQELAQLHWLLGPAMFIVFMIVVFLIIMNISFTIISESFAEVQKDIYNQENDYEILDFVLNGLKKSLRLVKSMVVAIDEDEGKDPVYIEFEPECIVERSNQLYRSVIRLYVKEGFEEEDTEAVLQEMSDLGISVDDLALSVMREHHNQVGPGGSIKLQVYREDIGVEWRPEVNSAGERVFVSRPCDSKWTLKETCSNTTKVTTRKADKTGFLGGKVAKSVTFDDVFNSEASSSRQKSPARKKQNGKDSWYIPGPGSPDNIDVVHSNSYQATAGFTTPTASSSRALLSRVSTAAERKAPDNTGFPAAAVYVEPDESSPGEQVLSNNEVENSAFDLPTNESDHLTPAVYVAPSHDDGWHDMFDQLTVDCSGTVEELDVVPAGEVGYVTGGDGGGTPDMWYSVPGEGNQQSASQTFDLNDWDGL